MQRGRPTRLLAELPVMQACSDLLAVGYASIPLAAESPGRAAVWSVRSPQHPVWSAATLSCVTAVDFAAQSQGLLAVGCYDGSLAIYNVKAPKARPAALAPNTSQQACTQLRLLAQAGCAWGSRCYQPGAWARDRETSCALPCCA